MKQQKMNRAFIGFVKLTGLPVLLYLKFKVFFEGKNKKLRHPKKPCIIMSNHTALLDFVLCIALFYFRTVRFLMAEILFDGRPLLNWFLRKMGGIRIDRNAYDFSFVGEALDTLDRGMCIGVFPEGMLPKGGKPLPFKPGIVYIALRTDAPIVPVFTDGNYGLFKRARVMIGEEIYLRDYCKTEDPSEEEIKDLTLLLEEKMNALREELEKRKTE